MVTRCWMRSYSVIEACSFKKSSMPSRFALLFSLLSIAGDPVTLEDATQTTLTLTIILGHAPRRCRTLFALSPRCHAADSPVAWSRRRQIQASYGFGSPKSRNHGARMDLPVP
jgi:hypothetical protein